MKDLKHLFTLERLLDDVDNELVRQATEDGRKCIGNICFQTPEVLMDLPGTFTIRLRAPRSGSMDMATYYMTSFLCEFSRAILERAIEGGYEVLESPMPALLTVIDANEPRPQHARRLMKFKKAKSRSEILAAGGDEETVKAYDEKGLLIREWSAAYAVPEDELNRLGFSGSPTKVKQIMSVVLTAGDYKKIEPTGEGVSGLIHELIADHTLG